jgi:hypothetical protein
MGPILWNVFINDLAPDVDYIKYADDTTIYNAISTSSATITEATSRKATLTQPHNVLQIAADKASVWCHNNDMLLNATKSSVITFSLRKNITADTITINGTPVKENPTTQLLGVTYDNHMKFSVHVDNTIIKSKPAFHALVNLRKAGVGEIGLGQFYKARVLSVLSYAAPRWYPFINKHEKEKLEKYQRLCLRIISPQLEQYSDRLAHLGVVEINTLLETVCLRYVSKIQHTEDHVLHSYIPGRISQHSQRRILPKCQTELLRKSLFHKYLCI